MASKIRENITIYGAGYVGLVAGVCFATKHHHVLMVDIDKRKIAALKRGELPIYEKGLEPIFDKAIQTHHLKFTSSVTQGIKHGDLQFIAVGTPSNPDGSVNTTYVNNICDEIANIMKKDLVIIVKSTVPIGTNENIYKRMKKILLQRHCNKQVTVVSNPEFLREGNAVFDFMHPDRTILGSHHPDTIGRLINIYSEFTPDKEKILIMDPNSAELCKYAANSYLAMRISFINEMSRISEEYHADVEQVHLGIGLDRRIGRCYLDPGVGYGGSCFPKDIKAFINISLKKKYRPNLIVSTQAINNRQIKHFYHKITRFYKKNIKDMKLAIWGLAFKPGTNDMRDAPSIYIIEQLLKDGAVLKVYDPLAMKEAKKIFKDRKNLIFCSSAVKAINQADGLIIITEWPEFKHFKLSLLKENLKKPVIFDGRNIYDPKRTVKYHLKYFSVGRD